MHIYQLINIWRRKKIIIIQNDDKLITRVVPFQRRNLRQQIHNLLQLNPRIKRFLHAINFKNKWKFLFHFFFHVYICNHI